MASLLSLPDDLLRHVLAQAYHSQIVAVVHDLHRPAIACSLLPCHPVSQRMTTVANQTPIRLLEVELAGEFSRKITRYLRSIRCPVQAIDFSDEFCRSLAVDWNPALEFVSHCPYPEQVQTINMTHRCWNKYCTPVSDCRHLQDMITTVNCRMPECKLSISKPQE